MDTGHRPLGIRTRIFCPRIMRCTLLIFGFISMFALWACADEMRYRVSVEHGRAAVRVRPDAMADPITALAFGTEVVAVATADPIDTQWLCIQAPEEVSLWIYADLVRDGKVAVKNALIRSGAGIGYKTVATLQHGAHVEPRSRLGDWIRIKPPPETMLWIARQDVEPLAIASDDITQPADTMDTQTDNGVPQAIDSPYIPIEVSRNHLSAAHRQGKPVTQQGRVDWSSYWEHDAPDACECSLLTTNSSPAAIIIDRSRKTVSCIGQSVTVKGTLWHLQDVSVPVLVAETTTPLE